MAKELSNKQLIAMVKGGYTDEYLYKLLYSNRPMGMKPPNPPKEIQEYLDLLEVKK